MHSSPCLHKSHSSCFSCFRLQFSHSFAFLLKIQHVQEKGNLNLFILFSTCWCHTSNSHCSEWLPGLLTPHHHLNTHRLTDSVCRRRTRLLILITEQRKTGIITIICLWTEESGADFIPGLSPQFTAAVSWSNPAQMEAEFFFLCFCNSGESVWVRVDADPCLIYKTIEYFFSEVLLYLMSWCELWCAANSIPCSGKLYRQGQKPKVDT